MSAPNTRHDGMSTTVRRLHKEYDQAQISYLCSALDDFLRPESEEDYREHPEKLVDESVAYGERVGEKYMNKAMAIARSRKNENDTRVLRGETADHDVTFIYTLHIVRSPRALAKHIANNKMWATNLRDKDIIALYYPVFVISITVIRKESKLYMVEKLTEDEAMLVLNRTSKITFDE